MHQIPERGSATADYEILHRITIEAKKGRNGSGAIITLPVPASCASQGATPSPIPYQAKY